MRNWKRVFSTQQSHIAEIVKAILEEHGMSPVLINKKDNNYLFGFYEIYVSPQFVLSAVKIIQDEVSFE